MKEYAVTIHVRVFDEKRLQKAAAKRAAADKTTTWKELRLEGDPVANDLIMLLDPGISPPGAEILETEAQGTFSSGD